jgi:hypothetical protein
MKKECIHPEKAAALLSNERGSAIVIALLTLVALTILGIIASTSSRIETWITTGDVLHKRAFYSADGGVEITREFIEQNLSCPGGFSDLNAVNTLLTNIRVTDADFAYQEDEASVDDNANGVEDFPADDERDIWFVDPGYALAADDGTPHTNTVAFGDTQLSTGSAIQMASGYEGKGKGAGAAGGEIVYEIHSRHEYRARGANSYIMAEYRHLIGQEGSCPY